MTFPRILRSPYFMRCLAMSLNNLLLTFEDAVVVSSSRFDRRCDSRRRDNHAVSKRRSPITQWHCATQQTSVRRCVSLETHTSRMCVVLFPVANLRRPPAASSHSGEAQHRVALRRTLHYTSRCLAANCRTVTSRPLAW